MHDGYCYKYDVSLPLPHFYQLVLDMRQRLGSSVTRVIGYGHVGDGKILYFLRFYMLPESHCKRVVLCLCLAWHVKDPTILWQGHLRVGKTLKASSTSFTSMYRHINCCDRFHLVVECNLCIHVDQLWLMIVYGSHRLQPCLNNSSYYIKKVPNS